MKHIMKKYIQPQVALIRIFAESSVLLSASTRDDKNVTAPEIRSSQADLFSDDENGIW